MMLQIQNTLVSLDLIERFFCCDLETCRGACCIEGDAGAPLTDKEYETLCEILPKIFDKLTPAAQNVIESQGPGYYDQEGDLVTSIVGGRECAFTCFTADGVCLCALEKNHKQGMIKFCKPESCSLYPVRIKEYDGFTAVNYHKWEICRSAEKKGRRLGLRLYEFLKDPLIRKFGQQWYEELCLTASEYLKSKQEF